MDFKKSASSHITRESFVSGALYLLGVSLVLYTLYYALELHVSRQKFAVIFLGVGLAIFYLTQLEDQESRAEPESSQISGFMSSFPLSPARILQGRQFITKHVGKLYVLLAIAALLGSLYVWINFVRLRDMAPLLGYTDLDYLVAAILVFTVMDATSRAYGWGITSVVLLSIGYAFAGPILPGIFGHTGFEIKQLLQLSAIGLTGIFGFILQVGVTWIAVFIFFAGLAKTYGLLDYIIELGTVFSGRFRTGIVHVATGASLALGSITGSAAANTATTGSFTIPMMKEQGVRADYAGAIESVASAGSQIMPPVMGVAAFLMADILRVPYVRVLQAGFLPALLFYGSLAVGIHLLTLRFDWTVEKDQNTISKEYLLEGIYYAIPLAALIYFLVVLRLTPLSAGLYTIITLVAVRVFRDLYYDGLEVDTIANTLQTTIDGFKSGAQEMAPLVGVLASMGIIVEIFTQTGFSQKLSTRMVVLAGGVFVVLLILTMLTSILFGLGIPTPAAYILVVILAAPALISFGVKDLTAHMFVFYFAMLSAITPPVAISVAIGCRIADASFVSTAKQALRIGAPGFIIPFAFVGNDNLIYWSVPGTLVSLFVVSMGLVALSVGLTGYNGVNTIRTHHKVLYILFSGGALFAPRPVQILAAVIVLLALSYFMRLKPLVDGAVKKYSTSD